MAVHQEAQAQGPHQSGIHPCEHFSHDAGQRQESGEIREATFPKGRRGLQLTQEHSYSLNRSEAERAYAQSYDWGKNEQGIMEAQVSGQAT